MINIDFFKEIINIMDDVTKPKNQVKLFDIEEYKDIILDTRNLLTNISLDEMRIEDVIKLNADIHSFINYILKMKLEGNNSSIVTVNCLLDELQDKRNFLEDLLWGRDYNLYMEKQNMTQLISNVFNDVNEELDNLLNIDNSVLNWIYSMTNKKDINLSIERYRNISNKSINGFKETVNQMDYDYIAPIHLLISIFNDIINKIENGTGKSKPLATWEDFNGLLKTIDLYTKKSFDKMLIDKIKNIHGYKSEDTNASE